MEPLIPKNTTFPVQWPMDGDGFSYSFALQRALSDGYIKNTSGNADTTETWHGSLRFSLDRGNGSKIGLEQILKPMSLVHNHLF